MVKFTTFFKIQHALIEKHSMLRLFFLSLCLFMSSQALASKAPPIHKNYPLDEVAPGVFVLHGPTEAPNLDNQGFINNPSFILTNEGVVVVDPGSSVQIGEMLMSNITNTTSKPVVAVFNTHVHGDHWLGNEAITAKYPSVKIYAHPTMSKMIEEGEGERWIDFMLDLSQGATAGTKAVGPTHSLNDGDVLTIGEISFQIIHQSKAHTKTDIMIYVKERAVIYLSDNGNQNFIVPVEGSFQGNIAALNDAINSGAKIFIPGHGKTSGPEVARHYLNFLTTIYETTRVAYEEGKSDYEIRPDLLPKLEYWKNWAGFENQLGLLINFAFLEAESADFE